MSKTILLCNPFGTDCTNFVNGSWGVPQLLKGSLFNKGDKVYTVPYHNTSGISNIEQGVSLLDTALHNIAGQKLVFGYSEGCQILDMWLANQGQSTPIDPGLLSFLSIANANSKYGGFAYNHAPFAPAGYIEGQPANCPYSYQIFTREFDGVADFPTDPGIQQVLVDVQAAIDNLSLWQDALNSCVSLLHTAKVPTQLYQLVAAENAVSGMVWIHNFYETVTPADPQNVSYTDTTNGVEYIWSPTYPVPLLGVSTLSSSADKQLRLEMARAFLGRPVAVPQPNYAKFSGWGTPTWVQP